MPKVQYQPVQSTNVSAIGYANGIGYIQFINGRRFGYTMSKEMFDQLAQAKSKGSFFAKSIKGHCPVSWSGWRCNNSPCQNDATLIGTFGNNPQLGSFHVCDECSKIARFQNVQFKPIEGGR